MTNNTNNNNNIITNNIDPNNNDNSSISNDLGELGLGLDSINSNNNNSNNNNNISDDLGELGLGLYSNNSNNNNNNLNDLGKLGLGLDLYTQAIKSLSEKSPFDLTEHVLQVPNNNNNNNFSFNLPFELSNLLSKCNENRKRRKSRPGPVPKNRSGQIWENTQEFFREFGLEDVEKLKKLSSLGLLADKGINKWLLVPKVGDLSKSEKNKWLLEPNLSKNIGKKLLSVPKVGEVRKNEVLEVKNELKFENEVKKETGFENLVEKVTNKEDNANSSFSNNGVEWLLGYKEKIHLTTERPSKKRKLLGENAGLEKVYVSKPVKGSLFQCDYCCMGDGDKNRLIVCCSCDMVVHQKCYGVLDDDIQGSWLCNWCKTSDLCKSVGTPCVLCPKSGGALKPLRKSGENGGFLEFAHLFCCQWMPETYVYDTKTMEPVMNFEGISDTRMKLVCSVCKVKHGSCVRCSNGTCRTSFHPICAREAGHRMEIWGKFGCDDVELRAYCAKHSKDQTSTDTQQSEHPAAASCSDSYDSKDMMLKNPHKLNIGRKNGDKVSVLPDATETEKPSNTLLHEEGLSDVRSMFRLQSNGDEAQRPVSTFGRITDNDVSTLDFMDYTSLLKKLVDRGKVNLKDVASEIGASPDSLASISSDNHLPPNLRNKLGIWLRSNAHIGILQKNLKLRIKSSLASKDDKGAVKDSNSASVALPDVPLSSASPHRITKSNIKILKGNEAISPREGESGDGLVMDEYNSNEVITEDADNSRKEYGSAPTEKPFLVSDGMNEELPTTSPKGREGFQEQAPILLKQNMLLSSVLEKSTCSILKPEVMSSSYIHPVIHEKILKMQNAVSPTITTDVNGSKDREISSPEVSSRINELTKHLNSCDKITGFDRCKMEQLADLSNDRLLKTCPGDEVEGELLYYQHRLLLNADTTRHIADNMMSEVVRSLPFEMDAKSKRNWDAVIVSQYMSEVKEAKKQGLKERRHREAQEVLSAATAAAAASSRMSSLRKDTADESADDENLMKVNTCTGRPGPYSQQMPRAKETVSKLAIPRISLEMKSGLARPVSSFNKEHLKTCDICSRSDTLLNPILVCSGCKVPVHLDCYRSVKDSIGPWYCELCEEERLSRVSIELNANLGEGLHLAVECGLCGGSGGAFRKSADGQWIHAYCAEWILESSFKRGQTNPIEGMEFVVKGNECHICHHKGGVCIKCNYGHCHSMFHPSCAKNAGFYMNLKNGGSKLQHRAYCQKHSLEQRAKALSQRYGMEELKNLKQIRVELERLRLLCERIIKREKLKRELVLCSQEVLVSKRGNAAFSALVRSPFFPAETSSESATTSLRGNTDDRRSGNEAIQRSDDVTVDSTVPGKRRIKFPLSKDDRSTDESSTSHLVMQKSIERASFAGKHIPHRLPFVSQNVTDGGEERKSKSRKV